MSIVQFVFCLKRKREIGIGDRAEIIDNQHSSHKVNIITKKVGKKRRVSERG